MIWLNIYLIVISLLLTAAILLQQRGAGGAGGAFGSDSGGAYHVKRGFEKWLFMATIALVVLFVGGAFTRLFLA
ncbi:MAG: preprotein translocase subunit SecG [Patescibacteria group bacterium]